MRRFRSLLLFCSFSFFAVGVQSQRRKGRRPNVVLLFMDDLGYGDMGFTGHPTTKTPNLDHLAYNGKILTTWYSGCSVCSGSRAALMTGRQFPRTGIPGVLTATGAIGLPLNETTLAEQLSGEGGYTTAIVGKWHLGQRQMHLPINRGFDYYLGMLGILEFCFRYDRCSFSHAFVFILKAFHTVMIWEMVSRRLVRPI
jgi:arylsulfatase A-like enzyme